MENTAKVAVPDQNMSQRLHQALTADKDQLYQVIQSVDGDLLMAALRNPALDEGHLLALLKRRGLVEAVFNAIYNGRKFTDSYKVTVALCCHPDAPLHIAQTLLPQFFIFDLIKVCNLTYISPDLRILAERSVLQRLAAQPLGNKLTLARRGTATIVEALLREGAPPQLVEACLDNPRLKEGALHQFIASPLSTAETISMVARNGRWKGRPNIRLAILKNVRTPAVWFSQLLPGLPRMQLKELLAVQRLTSAQKSMIRNALDGRRPL